MAFSFTFNDIQKRVDTLYDTKWFQANACYPVIFGYTTSDSTVDVNLLAQAAFLELHIESTGPNNLSGYLTMADKLALKKAPDTVLAQLSKISGLSSPTIPISRANGMLKAAKFESKDETVTLEFQCDRHFKVLDFLQDWQSKWFLNNYKRKVFLNKQKQHQVDAENMSAKNAGAEGFLCVANCSIDINGNVEFISCNSIFGLIPKNMAMPTDIGPGVSSSSLPTIKVTCTYSNAILVYPDPSSETAKLNYYYYK